MGGFGVSRGPQMQACFVNQRTRRQPRCLPLAARGESAISLSMANEQIVRINAALARIEAATAARSLEKTSSSAPAELKARHEALRAETKAAIAELNTLITDDHPREAS